MPGLLFADDVCVGTEEGPTLQSRTDMVDSWCKKWRIDINLVKSKVLVVGSPPAESPEEESFKFRGELVEMVESYKYLGCLLSS